MPFGAEYSNLIRAILEAEDDAERNLAELAFAILLLAHNYRLSPPDYESLLGSNSEFAGGRSGRNWQETFHRIAQDHVDSYLDFPEAASVDQPLLDALGRVDRLSAWLRNRLPSRWFSLESRR